MSRSSVGMQRTRTRLALAGLSALMAVSLAACGGSDEGATEAGGDAASVDAVAPDGAAVLLDAQALTALDQAITYPKKKKAQISSEIEVLEPGQESGWRKYRVPVYMYVTEGTISVEYDAGVVKDFPAGSSFVQATGIWHNTSNKGDVRAAMLTVTMGAKGTKSMTER